MVSRWRTGRRLCEPRCGPTHRPRYTLYMSIGPWIHAPAAAAPGEQRQHGGGGSHLALGAALTPTAPSTHSCMHAPSAAGKCLPGVSGSCRRSRRGRYPRRGGRRRRWQRGRRACHWKAPGTLVSVDALHWPRCSIYTPDCFIISYHSPMGFALPHTWHTGAASALPAADLLASMMAAARCCHLSWLPWWAQRT